MSALYIALKIAEYFPKVDRRQHAKVNLINRLKYFICRIPKWRDCSHAKQGYAYERGRLMSPCTEFSFGVFERQLVVTATLPQPQPLID
jgi:hypothetical protein